MLEFPFLNGSLYFLIIMIRFSQRNGWNLPPLNRGFLALLSPLCIGVLILSLVDTYAEQHVWIDGLETGFCSSLTTVSSFMNDILKLNADRKKSKSCFWLIYTYVFITLGLGILITQLVVKLG